MRPAILHELLAADDVLAGLGITYGRIVGAQSVIDRPFHRGHFIVVDVGALDYVSSVRTGPRDLTVAVHTPKRCGYSVIEHALARVDAVFRSVEHATGADGVTVSQIRKTGQSGNLQSERCQTFYAECTYGVSIVSAVTL